MLSSKNQSKGTKISATGASHPRLGVNKAAAAKAAGTQSPAKAAAPIADKRNYTSRPGAKRGGGGKLKLIIIAVVIIVIALGAWWFLGKDSSQPANPQSPSLPQRATLPELIEYAHNDIKITYRVGRPFEGVYIVMGFNSWEQNLRRFSDGHISLLPIAEAEKLRAQYGNLFNVEENAAALQAIRAASVNMPFIYSSGVSPNITTELQQLGTLFTPGRYIAVKVKGHLLTYEKGALNGRDMPAPQEQSGAAFNFVNLEEVKVENNNW